MKTNSTVWMGATVVVGLLMGNALSAAEEELLTASSSGVVNPLELRAVRDTEAELAMVDGEGRFVDYRVDGGTHTYRALKKRKLEEGVEALLRGKPGALAQGLTQGVGGGSLAQGLTQGVGGGSLTQGLTQGVGRGALGQNLDGLKQPAGLGLLGHGVASPFGGVKDLSLGNPLHLADKFPTFDLSSGVPSLSKFTGGIGGVQGLFNAFNESKSQTTIECLNPVATAEAPDGVATIDLTDQTPNQPKRVLTELFDARIQEDTDNGALALRTFKKFTKGGLTAQTETDDETLAPMVFVTELKTKENVSDVVQIECAEVGRFLFNFIIEISFGTQAPTAKQICAAQVICTDNEVSRAAATHPFTAGVRFSPEGAVEPRSLPHEEYVPTVQAPGGTWESAGPALGPLQPPRATAPCGSGVYAPQADDTIRFALVGQGPGSLFDLSRAPGATVVGVAAVVDQRFEPVDQRAQTHVCTRGTVVARRYVALLALDGEYATAECTATFDCTGLL